MLKAKLQNSWPISSDELYSSLYEGIENKEMCKRFVIELSPKLREIGITTCVTLTKDMKAKEYKDIVDYIAEK